MVFSLYVGLFVTFLNSANLFKHKTSGDKNSICSMKKIGFESSVSKLLMKPGSLFSLEFRFYSF